MLYLVDLVRLRIDPLLAVIGYCTVFPAAFQQFVQHLHVFVGLVVAAVVFGLLLKAHGPGGTVQIAGDDVPAHPATAQVIEGRELAGEQIGRLVGQVGGQAEAQMPGHRGHGRHQQQRVVDRQLDRLLERYLDVVLVNVVDPDDVGDEQAVEQPALKQPRQFSPVLQRLVLGGRIPWVSPQTVVDVANAVHVEGIEEDFLLGHQMVPRSGGFSSLR
ncbi:hypothetical protein D3C81_979210 [compost metagenome]